MGRLAEVGFSDLEVGKGLADLGFLDFDLGEGLAEVGKP